MTAVSAAVCGLRASSDNIDAVRMPRLNALVSASCQLAVCGEKCLYHRPLACFLCARFLQMQEEMGLNYKIRHRLIIIPLPVLGNTAGIGGEWVIIKSGD